MSEQMNNIPNDEKEEKKTNESASEEVISEKKSDAEDKQKRNKKNEVEYTSIFDSPVNKDKKTPGTKKKLPKQAYTAFMALGICCALLAGIFAIDKFLAKPEDTSSSTSSSGVTYIYDYYDYLNSKKDTEYLNIGGVKKITVTNQLTSFVTEPEETVKTSTDESTGETTTTEGLNWNITDVPGMDYQGVVFNNTTTSYILADVLRVSYFGVYTDDVNAEIPEGGKTYFEECGFDNPTAFFKIEFEDGSFINLYVGNETPTKDGYFVYADNHPAETEEATVSSGEEVIPVLGRPEIDTKVYKSTQDAISFLLKGLNTIVEKDIVTKFTTEDEDDDYFSAGLLIKYDSIALTTKTLGRTYDFSCIETDSPAMSNIYYMAAPANFNPKIDSVDAMLSPLAEGLSASDCYVVKYTDEDLAAYGLDSPEATIDYVVKGEEIKLNVAPVEGEDYYAVTVDGLVSIYKVSKTYLDFVEYDLDDWRNNLLYANNITNVKSIAVESKNDDGSVSSTVFNLVHGVDDEGEATLDVTTSSGKTINTEDFRTFYSTIISTSAEDYVDDAKESSSPAFKISISYNGYSAVDVLKYSDYSARRYYFTLNGKNGAIVLSTVVDSLVSEYKGLLG